MNNHSNNVRSQLINSGLVKQASTVSAKKHSPRLFNDVTLAIERKNKEATKRALAILSATIQR